MYSNVKYELHELERLISTGWPTTTAVQEEHVLKDTITKEVERIKHTFINEVFGFEDERHLERYIQYHQQGLIYLMDRTAHLMTSAEESPVGKGWHVYHYGLEELLSFVERHFSKYFDQDAKAPESYIAIARQDTKANVQKLQYDLLQHGADTHLIDVLLYGMHKFLLGSQTKPITYRQVIYVKAMQKELFRLLHQLKTNHDINEEIRLVMYYLNYNSIRCFGYHTQYIHTLLDEVESRTEKIERLSLLLKNLNQAQTKPGIGYNLRAPSIHSQLNSYIIEEIEHYERLQQLANLPPSRSAEALLTTFKIQFELSVAQIAYFIKVLIETKIIVAPNVTGLLRFLSKILLSRRAETFTYDSLRTKYYNVESGTRDAVKRTLLILLTHIGKSDTTQGKR